MSNATHRRCDFCLKRHPERYLCDPVRRVVKAMQQRGMDLTMPTLEFPEPIRDIMPALGLNPGDALLSQLVVNAGIVAVDAIARPAVIFTGRTPFNEVLPRWMYAGTDEELTRVATLVRDMTEIAIRGAAKARGESSGVAGG